MENNFENKIEFKDRIIYFYNQYKKLIFLSIVFIIILLIFLTFYSIRNEKRNNLISEKYIQAGLYLSAGQNDKSKKIYEEILKTNNSFYSTLSLNNILEKELEKDENKIVEYFNIVSKLQKNNEQKDILKLKKALYLIKISKKKEAEKLIKELINSNSKFKDLAKQILPN